MSDAPHPEITTRLAGAGDADGVQRMVDLFRAEHGYEQGGAVPAPEGGFNVLVAERNGSLVGLLALQSCHDLARGTRFLLLSDIFVVKEERRQGVARELMRSVREIAAGLGCEGMSLVVSEVNVPALTTAARAGFTRHDQLLFTFDPGER